MRKNLNLCSGPFQKVKCYFCNRLTSPVTLSHPSIGPQMVQHLAGSQRRLNWYRLHTGNLPTPKIGRMEKHQVGLPSRQGLHRPRVFQKPTSLQNYAARWSCGRLNSSKRFSRRTIGPQTGQHRASQRLHLG